MKKYTRKKVELQCNHCKKIYLKDESEHKRNVKLKRIEYCSIICSKKSDKNVERLLQYRNKDLSKLKADNRKDCYSPFREHLRRAKRRDAFSNLTLEHLKEVWEKQNGICPYSKVKLLNSSNTKTNNPIYTLSLDRIDSSKGYVEGNIQFVSIAMNHMKGNMAHDKVLELLEIIKNSDKI
jgi:hypothetical protein